MESNNLRYLRSLEKDYVLISFLLCNNSFQYTSFTVYEFILACLIYSPHATILDYFSINFIAI